MTYHLLIILYYRGDLNCTDGGGLRWKPTQTRKQDEIAFRTPLVVAHNYIRSDHIAINPVLYII